MTPSLKSISVASDGSIFGVDSISNNVLAATAAPVWTQVPGQLSMVSAASDGTVWGIGIGPNGGIYAFDGSQWSQVACPYSLTQISVGSAQNIWGVDGQHRVYTYASSTGWVTVSGAALISISAASDGTATGWDAQGNIWQYNGGSWNQISTSGLDTGSDIVVAVAAGEADWIMALTKSGAIYQYDGPENQWLRLPAPAIPAREIDCGDDDSIWILDNDGRAYQYDAKAQGWTPINLPFEPITDLAVGNAQNVWCVDESHSIYQYTKGTYVWAPVTPASSIVLTQVAAASASSVWGLDDGGNVYEATGGASNWNPTQIPWSGPAAPEQIAAAEDRTTLVVSQGAVYGYAGGGVWSRLNAPPDMVSVSAGASTIMWGCDSAGTCYQVNPDAQWIPQGAMAQVSVAADRFVVGLDSTGALNIYFGNQLWYQTARMLQAVSAGSATNVWGIDVNGEPVQLKLVAGEQAAGSRRRVRWSTDNAFDEAQSTHLWIVNRAAILASQDPAVGSQIAGVLQPNTSQTGPSGNVFHDQMCQGLYDADYKAPYDSPILGYATWASHFYDPDTGLNYIFQTSPTALTQCRSFFWSAVEAYVANDQKNAGYYLGLALHYFTDATQPMHAANFTWFNSTPLFGYHTAFEDYVMAHQASVASPSTYVPGTQGIAPDSYLIKAASNAKNNYYSTICPTLFTQNYLGIIPYPQMNEINSVLSPMLQGAIKYTSQCIAAWMNAVNLAVNSVALVCAEGGQVADLKGSKPGAKAVTNPWSDDRSQKFSLRSLSGADDGYFAISSVATSLVMDAGGSTSAGPVALQTWAETDTQKWQVAVDSNGMTGIYNKLSGLALTATTGKDGVQLTQTEDSNGLNQRWIMPPGTSVAINLMGGTAGQFVADIKEGSRKPGKRLQLHPVNGNPSQRFLLVPLPGNDNGYAILAACSGLAIMFNAQDDSLNQQPFDLGNTAMMWAQIPASADSSSISIRNTGTGCYWYAPPPWEKGTLVLGDNTLTSQWTIAPYSSSAARSDAADEASTPAALGMEVPVKGRAAGQGV
jgi:hypothetical protein